MIVPAVGVIITSTRNGSAVIDGTAYSLKFQPTTKHQVGKAIVNTFSLAAANVLVPMFGFSLCNVIL